MMVEVVIAKGAPDACRKGKCRFSTATVASFLCEAPHDAGPLWVASALTPESLIQNSLTDLFRRVVGAHMTDNLRSGTPRHREVTLLRLC
jgi:hypothetical protein